MPTVNMFKGPAARAVDEWYATGNVTNNLQTAQGLLSGGMSFGNIVAQLVGQRRWNAQFGYPLTAVQGDAFETVARQAYLEGIALALLHKPPVPISTVWVADANAYEAHAIDGLQVVTVTLGVPVPAPTTPPAGLESWAVEVGGGGQAVVTQLSGPADATQPSAR
jgi:hypothetical protein